MILLSINKHKMVIHPRMQRAGTSVGYFTRVNLSNRTQKYWDHYQFVERRTPEEDPEEDPRGRPQRRTWTWDYFNHLPEKTILEKTKSDQTLHKIFQFHESHCLQCFKKSLDLPNVFLVFPRLNNFSCVLHHCGTCPVVSCNELITNNWLHCEPR